MVPENKQNRRYKLTLLAFKIIAILNNTLLATFIKLLETVSNGLQAPDQGSTVDFFLFPRLKSIMLTRNAVLMQGIKPYLWPSEPLSCVCYCKDCVY
jgi:hypothetical protein